MQNNKVDVFERIEQIKSDTVHGANFLTKASITLIKEYLTHCSEQDSLIPSLQKIICSLVHAQRTMASLFNLGNELLLFIDAQKHLDTNELKQSLQNWCTTYLDTYENSTKKIAKHLAPLIPEDSLIGTYSFSQTVYTSLLEAYQQKKSFRVLCSESRPAYEGKQIAKRLVEKNIPTTFTTDALFFSKIPDVDLLLVGADALSSKGVVNKVGTYPLACIAKQTNIPVYTLCSTLKILPNNVQLPKEPSKNPDEIYRNAPNSLNIEDYYFDTTPLKYFTLIITDQGPQTPSMILQQIKSKTIHPLLKKNL